MQGHFTCFYSKFKKLHEKTTSKAVHWSDYECVLNHNLSTECEVKMAVR